MSKIPTAEEFQKNYSIEYYDEGGYQGVEEKEVSNMLIEFTKLHVEAALEARDRLYQTHFDELSTMWTKENIEFIKKSYPLENIK